MKRAFVVAFVFAVIVAAAAADEKPLESRITSVGLFKNGLAVVQRTAVVPGPGTYRVEDVPEPVHGTYWVESNAKIVTRLSHRAVEVPANRVPGSDLQEELAGKEVTIYFADRGVPPATGTVVAMEPAQGDDAWARDYEQPRYSYYSYYNRYAPPQAPAPAKMLVLKTDKGRAYVDSSRIAYVQAVGAGEIVRRRAAVLLFSVEAANEKPTTIFISYLTKGMAWAPSYRVDISDPKTLVLQQKAVVKNELESLDGAEIQLISGFPSIEFANVMSPLSLSTTWTKFFQQLSQRYSSGGPGSPSIISQQAVVSNFASPEGGIDLSAMPSGEGVDLHYQNIGRQTLAEGESLALETASAKADYDRIVEWIVPDIRDAYGRYILDRDRTGDPERFQDTAWDAVRFRNPLDFPMTTAPAMVVAGGGRFNGQRMSYWVNRGEETTLHVTKALSVRTRSVEQELEGKRETVYLGGYPYQKTTVLGELRANNHRKEPIALVIRRRFSGDLLEADGSPESMLLEEGAYSVNKRNQLTWSLSLKPGEEVKLTYRYSVLVRR
jgi:hypothetical protein